MDIYVLNYIKLYQQELRGTNIYYIVEVNSHPNPLDSILYYLMCARKS